MILKARFLGTGVTRFELEAQRCCQSRMFHTDLNRTSDKDEMEPKDMQHS